MSLSLFAASTRAPRWRWWRLVLRVGGWAVLSAWSLVLLAWLTLHWGILPRLDEWRPRIEVYASHALGQTVEIGRIEVRSSGWVPALTLHDVVLRDPRGREALRLPLVAAALSVPSLLSLQLRFDQLLIDGPRLEVRRDAQGRLRVAGIDMDGEAMGTGGGLADRFFEQHEFVIRGGVLRWVDEFRGAPPLELTDVQLVVRNRLTRHDMRLDATPPPGWGQRFTLVARARQPLLANAGDWQRWRGTLYADLPQVLVQQLRRHVDLPFDLDRGEGALRAWVDFEHGLPQGGTADLALRDVSARLASGLEPMALAQVRGRVVVERQPEGVRIVATGFGFDTAEGQRWPAGRMVLSWQQAQVMRAQDLGTSMQSRPVTSGEFSAERLDLALMAQLGERLPLGTGVQRLLETLDPRGTVTGLVAGWRGPIDAPTHYNVKAEVQGMAIAAAASSEPGGVGRPGWRGADLSFSGTESGGQAKLSLQDGALELPGVFEQPVVPLRRFAAQLGWRIEPVANGRPRIELKVGGARFENDDTQGELEASWRTGTADGFGKGARLPGVLELSGKLSQGQAVRVARYLPLGIAASARDYVRRAVQGGRVLSAAFKVKGDLWDFPFVQRNDGEFRIAAQVQDVTLAYVPSVPATSAEAAWTSPWPAFGAVSGELVFDRTSMQIQQARGRLWGVEFTDVSGGIPNLVEPAVLELEGHGRGPAADFLRYVNTTPIGGWLNKSLAQSTAEGLADLKLSLRLPLHRLDEAQVRGSVQLLGGDLRIRPETPMLGAARGRVDFTQQGLRVAGTARAFGGEASIDGGTQADGSLRFGANGTASAEGLRRASELGIVSRWAARAEGQAPYRLQLGFARGVPEILVTSPLTGMALNLPAPIGKAAEAALPLRVQIGLAPEARAANTPLRDLLRVDLGSLLSAQYLRDLGGDEPQVLRGAVAVNAPLPEMTAGVRAVVRLGDANADAWLALLPEGSLGSAPGAAVARASTSPAASSSTATVAAAGASAPAGGAVPGAPPALVDAGLGYRPKAIELEALSLTLASRRLTHLTLSLARTTAPAPGWRAQVDADQLRGEVAYLEPRGPADAGRVRARLARLSLPQSEADSVEGLLDQAPASVPALDLEAEEFELRGRKLGKLSVEAVNRSRGGVASAREWRLNRLALQSADTDLQATGQWAHAQPGDARRHMNLDFTLNTPNAGALLERLGFGKVIRGGKGGLEGQVSWAGSPLGLDLPTLSGRMNVALEAGQFLKAEPGAGRLLGVLSLQALPRRLVLDFRDVFQEGFAFDNISGDVQVDRGVARTNNLRMRGVQAAVLMEGSADITQETQELRVVVVPEINAGTASLAYAVINPAIGLGTFLGQWLLRGPLAEAGTREFRVYGSWTDPQVAPVERRPAAAAAASAPASRSP
ncbi:YhdP family protein [Ideonella sp. A 288]|uniref:YhdP family protein n=1 Tax=Ideonella sp. A 288 TaxID=1962181 RepID=UPI001303DD80|nr:YhdP family protein [Ideonella sp. A 288]